MLISKGFAQPTGYTYGKQLLVDGTKVSGSTDLIDFTMLVSMTDPDLRSVSNGGHVENANGYELLINTNNLLRGIYFVEVSKDGVKKVQKFIRE